MNVIETRDLCKQYGAALRVAHLNLNVPEGSVYGFLGPNGAGKSTTLKMLLGLVRPTDVYKRQPYNCSSCASSGCGCGCTTSTCSNCGTACAGSCSQCPRCGRTMTLST